jgi:hypothetical protein
VLTLLSSCRPVFYSEPIPANGPSFLAKTGSDNQPWDCTKFHLVSQEHLDILTFFGGRAKAPGRRSSTATEVAWIPRAKASTLLKACKRGVHKCCCNMAEEAGNCYSNAVLIVFPKLRKTTSEAT